MSLSTCHFNTMTESAFAQAIADLAETERSRAIALYRRWRFAYRRTSDGRPPECASGWLKAAEAAAAEITAFLDLHRPQIVPAHHCAQISALRALAVTAARRGAIQ